MRPAAEWMRFCRWTFTFPAARPIHTPFCTVSLSRSDDGRIEMIHQRQHHINASAGYRARESEIRLCVTVRRVNVLLASFGSAPHCTRRPAPGVLLLGFRAPQDHS